MRLFPQCCASYYIHRSSSAARHYRNCAGSREPRQSQTCGLWLMIPEQCRLRSPNAIAVCDMRHRAGHIYAGVRRDGNISQRRCPELNLRLARIFTEHGHFRPVRPESQSHPKRPVYRDITIMQTRLDWGCLQDYGQAERPVRL